MKTLEVLLPKKIHSFKREIKNNLLSILDDNIRIKIKETSVDHSYLMKSKWYLIKSMLK
jgi:hypothetical protein